MDLRQLRTFVAVAEHRHFARAATACHLSQPAVSHQIRLLEAAVGLRLLNRTARNVSLTVAGEVLLDEARRILAGIERAQERLQEVARGSIGRIRLGASATPGLYLLPPLLSRYRAEHPAFELRFEIGSVRVICDKVSTNALDMALIAGPSGAQDLRCRPIVDDDLVIVTAGARAAAARSGAARSPAVKAPARRPKPAATPAELAAETWIVREEHSDSRHQVTTWWHRHRIAPKETMTFDGPDAVKRAVAAGLGIAMVSRLTVQEDVDAGRLALVTVRGALPSRSIHLVDHPHKHHGAACRAMIALLTAQA
jgi:DNA-binding transcriptional LysR family regulator